MATREVIIYDTHRGLYYEDGRLVRVLDAGRYVLPRRLDLFFVRRPQVEIKLVDVRERELTIKGQEILTADKVALRVSCRPSLLRSGGPHGGSRASLREPGLSSL